MSLDKILTRELDIIGSLTGMVLLSPIYLGISAAIYFIDGSPIIYEQSCFGKNGEPFTMYKFRTFEVGYPTVSRLYAQETGVTPRYTKTGRTLRRLKLNELPQLYNILKGEMSFVGPRPCLNTDNGDDPHGSILNEARIREGIADIKPGLTGYTQLQGGELALEEMIRLDRQYLLWENPIYERIKLLFKTLKYFMNYKQRARG